MAEKTTNTDSVRTASPSVADTRKKIGEILSVCGKMVIKWGWLVLLIFSIILIGYYIIFPSRGYFHSDSTDTLMWAQASYDSGTLFNPNFHYACLLPFGTSLIMLALIPFFGVSMTTHILGMLIFFLLFTASLIWMLREMEWSWQWISVAVFTELMLCSGSTKLREIFWGHTIYYSLGVFFIFTGLALLFRHFRLSDKSEQGLIPANKMIVSMLLIALWFILTCSNQLIAMTIFAFPVMAALFSECFLNTENKLLCRNNRQSLLLLGVMAAGTVMGYLMTLLLSDGIVAGYESGYSSYSDMNEWMDNLLKFPVQWFTLLGAQISKNDPLLSLDSVKALLVIIAGVLLIVIPVIALCCYAKIKDRRLRILILTFWFMTLLIMLGYICGKLSSANWRLSPIVAMSALLTVAFLRWAVPQISMQRIISLLMIPVMLVAVMTSVSILQMPADNRSDSHLYKLAEFLEEHDLNYGYATFWNANGLTVVSNSAVQCRSITLDENGVSAYRYQSNNAWFEDQPGQSSYFLLMSQSEETTLIESESPLLTMAHGEISCDGYVVYIFNTNIF
jgi:hypothetical protein